MLVFAPIVREPKESEMALSTQVQESVNTASSALREALAFAASGEHSLVITTIADILARLDSLEAVDALMDRANQAGSVRKVL